jgi:hypothetical protein
MEHLKPLAELVEPDERQRFFARYEPELCGFRSLRREDVYQRASEISLHTGVPESIRSHFATATNLLAYSWFYYPFNVTAELSAYISVEFALKLRFQDVKSVSLKRLLERAIREGLLTEAGFSFRKEQINPEPHPDLKQTAVTKPKRDIVREVVDAMRDLRNDLAHGSNTLHMKGAGSVLFCSEIINQLFPPLHSDG